MSVIQTIGNNGCRLDLLVSRGDDFGPHEIILNKADGAPLDLTNLQLVGSIKKTVKDTTVVCPIEVFIPTGHEGRFFFGISHEATGNLALPVTSEDPRGKYVWDMKLIDGANRRIPLFNGIVTVKASVTP